MTWCKPLIRRLVRWFSNLKFYTKVGRYFGEPGNQIMFKDGRFAVTLLNDYCPASVVLCRQNCTIHRYMLIVKCHGQPLIEIFDGDGTAHGLFDMSPANNTTVCDRVYAKPIPTVELLHEMEMFIKIITHIDVYKHIMLSMINCKHYKFDVYAIKIQKAWRNCISNPKYAICRRRLQNEFSEFII